MNYLLFCQRRTDVSDTPRTDTNLRGSDTRASSPFAEFTRQLERELAAERKRADEAEQRHADATGEWKRQKEAAQILLGKYEDAKNRADEAEKDAKRYRWLREQHEGIGPLNYDADGVMMPVEPTEIAFTVFRPDPSGDESLSVVGCIPGELDAAIDEAMKNG